MAIISSYPVDSIVQDGDAWIGTEVGNNSTRQYTAAKVAEYLNIQGKVSIGGQMSYEWVDSPRVKPGSIAFPAGGGSGTPFSAISSLNLHYQDLSKQETTAYLEFLVGKSILIASQSDKQAFGWYTVLEYEIDELNNQFYNIGLSYIDGNGVVLGGGYYNMLYFASSSGGGGGGGGTVIVANDTGLAIDNNILSTTYNTTMLDGVRSTATGGAEPALASDWKKKSIVEVLDTILFPTTQASVSAPASATLTNSNTATKVEVGTIKENVLTATFDRGKIENGDGSVGPDLVGPATNYKFEGTGITSPINQTNNNDLTVSTEIVDGDNEWKVTISHDVGTGDYFDNKNEVGGNLVEQRSVGSKVGYTPTVTGAYKQFYGPSASLVTTSAGVRSLPSSRFNVTGSFVTPIFNDVKFVIAIPATRTLVSVITSNNETITANFVLSTFNVNDAGGNAVSYDVYTFTSVIALGVTATVTIS
jgi:hypothetical protein